MIRLPYFLMRWVIAALSLLLLIAAIVAQPTGGALVLLVLLMMASVGAIVYPPGIWVWLLTPICPKCHERVKWAIEQGSTNPYMERLVMQCPGCAKEQVEFLINPVI